MNKTEVGRPHNKKFVINIFTMGETTHWEQFSGTGEQQQEKALVHNLEKVKTDLSESINRVEMIKSQKLNELVNDVKDFIKKIEEFSASAEKES